MPVAHVYRQEDEGLTVEGQNEPLSNNEVAFGATPRPLWLVPREHAARRSARTLPWLLRLWDVPPQVVAMLEEGGYLE